MNPLSATKLFTGSARRITAFAVFGVSGLALTATWAASVTSTAEGAVDPQAAGAIALTLPTGNTPELDTAITNADMDAGLPMDFDGRWGAIPIDVTDGGANDPDSNLSTTAEGDYELFEVNLSSFAGTRDFFVEITMGNEPNDFTVLQVQFAKVDSACATADLDNSSSSAPGHAVETLFVESSDATAVFELPNSGGDTVCIGVIDTDGDPAMNEAGTFIRRNVGDTSEPDPMPIFSAILGEYVAP